MVESAMALPPGFRFHPTDEEVITSYLLEKLRNPSFTCRAVGEADLNKCEPWDLPSKAKMGEKEWYFFCHKGMKYPTGSRTNRATKEGYWKATGKDREIFAGGGGALVGMRKTLVFYMGRAPRGTKTNWVMHEFRLEGKSRISANLRVNPKDEWVVCKVFHKGEAKAKAGAAAVEESASAGTTPNVSSVDAGEGEDDFLDYYSLLDPIDFTSSASSLPLPAKTAIDAGYSIPTGSFVLPNYSLTNTSNQHFAVARAANNGMGGGSSSSNNNVISLNRDDHQAAMAKALGGAIGSNFAVPNGLPSSASAMAGVSKQIGYRGHPYYNSRVTTGAAAIPGSMENLGAHAW